MKDIFKYADKLGGPGGIKCPCCDNGYCRKRKSKHFKHALSQLRRTILKRNLLKLWKI